MPRTPLLMLLGLAALWSVGCYQSASGQEGVPVISGEPTAIPTAAPIYVIPEVVVLSVATPAPVAATPEPIATVVATPVATATPKPTAAVVVTAEPTATAEPTVIPPPAGSPFGASQLLDALAGRGVDYELSEVRTGCVGEASGAHRYVSADGPDFTLWVYPGGDALKADWVLPSSGAPSPRIAGCEIDGGWVYWNENVLLAFEPQQPWIEAAALRQTVVNAFWSLTR